MKKVRILAACLALLLLCAVACPPLRAATYFVRQAGNDRADGSSPQKAFRSLLRAAQVLNHGDTVVVGPGTYRESVLVAERFGRPERPLAILGDEQGRRTGDRPGEVVLEPASAEVPALHLHRAREAVISGLTFRGAGEGLRLEKCLAARVQRCTFDGLARGLSLSRCQDVRVESTVLKRCTIGMLVDQAVRTRVAHVTVAGSSSVGILILSSGEGSLRNSILAANNTSLVADPASAPSWSSDHNVQSGTIGAWGAVPVTYNAYEWFAASGMERHSVHVVPAFADPGQFDLHVDPAVTWGGGLPGMAVGLKPDPEVELDRDGRPFTLRDGAVCAGAYDYPDPRPGRGWKKLPVRLAKGGPRHSAALYRPDGTLVRMLLADAAGAGDLWWDGLDDQGQPAPPGPYTLQSALHNVRLLNDGHFGDNGNPLGTYNCDNADRVVAFPDGSFVVSTGYDEAGIPLRYYAPSGQPVSGSALAEKDIWAIAAEGGGKALIGGVAGKLVRIVPPGERTRMANGAESYSVLAAGESLGKEADGQRERMPAGLAVLNGAACVALPGLDVLRVIDLADGRKKADWPVKAVADVACDEKKTLWAISGTDVVAMSEQGKIARRAPTGLKDPRYLAAGDGKLAVVDRQAGKVALLDAASGRLVRHVGRDRPEGRWLPVSADLFAGPRGAAFLPDGQLLLTESGRVRAFWPGAAVESFAILSNFLDAAVPHPARPEYVYCYGGNVFHVDPETDAWTWKLEGPPRTPEVGMTQMAARGTLGGRHFILAHNDDRTPSEPGKPPKTRCPYCLIDVTEPLAPRLAGRLPLPPWAYTDVRFTGEGHLVYPVPNRLQFKVVPFLGLDARNDPRFDFDNPKVVGPEADAEPRAMGHKGGVTIDPAGNDLYYLAVTARHNKMVPFWGASGTGVGKSRADGTPLWFSLSSGGNYTSISSVRQQGKVWVFAGKDFGGQIDVFDPDGLRLTTSNWGWPSNWQSGFIDIRAGVQAYLRHDGRPGVYVEDDNIGRFGRCRLEGGETLRRDSARFDWTPAGAAVGPGSTPHETAGRPLENPLLLPRVPEWPVDGDWSRWEKAGVVPQMVCLPIVTWGRTWPADLMQSFRAGTAVGAFAHDGRSLYAYFLVADDSPHFDDETGARMWMYDSIELWIEEEQIGIGLRRNGRPALFKYRFHDREGKQYAAGYALPDANVWGKILPSLAEHPLGRHLAGATGASFEGKPGYALMAKVPFEEIKLVGGTAGRKGDEILPMTGRPGELLRIGVAVDAISYWGREQDYKVYWPCGLMFSDPTRNVPFRLGP